MLAIFDKPDPLEGPFFEEMIYVTPSRESDATQRAIVGDGEEGSSSAGATPWTDPRGDGASTRRASTCWRLRHA